MISLTKRQREVLKEFVATASIKCAARNVGISRKTADHHLERARAKLGVNNSMWLAMWAVKEGIVEFPFSQ